MTLNAGSTAESLYIEVHGNSTAFHISPGASADRVFVTTTATGDHACYMQEAVLTNSVCWAGDTGDLAMETDGSNTMRNDTFFGGTDEALMAFGRHCSCDFTDTLVNVILRSASGGIDINAESDGNGSITVDVTHSNYETTATTGAGAPDKTIIAGDATNQTATPLFVDAAAGDFHEAAGSPTIDAGINDAANGTNDLDGDPRTTNGTTDIGAFEFGAPGPTPPDTRITKSTIKPGKRKATFEFAAIGDATGFECALARSGKPLTFKTCSSPKSYRNLKDGHYKFKVRALSSAGADPTPATKTFKI
jgi:hypothetical protein